jgi:hypothetical protein
LRRKSSLCCHLWVPSVLLIHILHVIAASATLLSVAIPHFVSYNCSWLGHSEFCFCGHSWWRCLFPHQRQQGGCLQVHTDVAKTLTDHYNIV